MRKMMVAMVFGAVATVVAAQEPCCDQKVCRATTEEKKTDKRVFGSACEEFCLAKCSWSSLFHRGCCDGTCCEDKVRCRKYLVVKIRKEETCASKCVVESLAPSCCVTPGSVPPVPPMVPVPMPRLATPPAK
jgi:hypothetical protein